MGHRVHVGHHRDGGRAEAGRAEGRIQPVLGGRHQWGVEGAPHRQGHHPFGPELLGPASGLFHAGGGAGDHDLAGRVVVGHPRPVDPFAGGGHAVGLEAEHRRHRPRPGLGGVLHGLAPLGHQAGALVVRYGAGGDQGGVLTEAVAGHGGHVRPVEAAAAGGVENDQAEGEGGDLGVPRGPKGVGVGVEEQGPDVAPTDLAEGGDP